MSLDVTLYQHCSHCDHESLVFDANITHNLSKTAEAALIYSALWHPNENGLHVAKQLIEGLERGVADMRADPEKFRKYDSPNGWGTYDNFLPWVERYLEACKKYPNAKVSVSR